MRLYRAWHLYASGLVDHGFSTRIGGSSVAPYDTLNLGLGVADRAEDVISNRRAFAEALGVDASLVTVARQVHSDKVAVIRAELAGAGSIDHAESIPDADALITNTPGIPLALHFADCACIFLLDPVTRAIGVVHAGWKGTAKHIVKSALEKMVCEYGARPERMLAAIGPCIGRCCYDVGEDVASELSRAFPHEERVIRQSSKDKWRADLKTANVVLLKQAGLKDANIAVSGICTACSGEEFFSYRRDGETGRMGGWMALRGL